VALESRTQKATNQKKKIKKLKASLKEESRQREKFESIAFSRSAQNDSEKRDLEDKLHRQQKISDELERELAYLKQPTASVAAQSLTAENARLTREMEKLKDKTQKRIEEEQNKTEELKAKMQKRIEEEQNKRINLEYRSREWTDRIQALQRDLDLREREVRDARRELQQGNMHAQQLLTAVALQQHAQPPVANPHAAHYALPPPQSAYNPTPTGAYAGHAGALSGGYHPPARRSRASVVEQNTD
jgi:chromosome segregation ATPase